MPDGWAEPPAEAFGGSASGAFYQGNDVRFGSWLCKNGLTERVRTSVRR
jgi:hypothetical protein